MSFRCCLITIGLLCSLVLRTADADPRPEVVFLSPDDSTFWTMTADFMEAVAADLGMELEVQFDQDRNRFSYQKLAEQVLGREDRPDYLMFMSKENVTETMLTLADNAGVKVFTFNTDIPPETRVAVGSPRERIANWIGHLVPDNVAAGRTLANTLVRQARHLGLSDDTSPPAMIALSGSLDSSAATDRDVGLQQVADENRIELLQLIYSDWNRDLAQEKTRVLLARYPQTVTIWSASDGMAIGAVDAAKLAGRKPGLDLVIGGVDWEPEALVAVRQGELGVSLGRHFMGGGLALLLIHDYHAGLDFASNESSASLKYQFEPATIDNVDRVQRVMDPENWRRVDFREFSRVHNSDLSEQTLSADHLMDAFVTALAAEPDNAKVSHQDQ